MSDFTRRDVVKVGAGASNERFRVQGANRMKRPWRAAAVAAVTAVALAGGAAAQSSSKVLKFIPEADLRILDPITTTAYITRNHGYMIYDTLFATDAKFQVQPQMVDKYELSKDQLTYTFTLREGLKFHDGA